ncbi:23S rRNA (adenine(1618)-N(6))-methyltransferase RlmF [Vibrio maerlii]|uniref:23S rRNA (adenine(1618)-N(6))-methyltransferase RlmF n=1 Tax=Vibrio maerlii TaxID=2231648 RepID=UPI000E3BCD54|nr:23S rRNA (adenine(1618)-N(6))-methyltransferase RlmF [Vibrio maerlii]
MKPNGTEKATRLKREKSRSKTESRASSKGQSNAAKSDTPSVPVIKVRANGLHKANTLKGNYNFKLLTKLVPELASKVVDNPKGGKTISFSDSVAVKLLNKGLLAQHFDVTYWDIPQGYLCPPIPGRADYIHRAAEMLEKSIERKPAELNHLDIGAGANCIYPIVGCQAYHWHSVGADIDPASVKNAKHIVEMNPNLKGSVELRLQKDNESFFAGVIKQGERYHITTCNPPFHQSAQEAMQGTQRKVANLAKSRNKRGNQSKVKPETKDSLNFGGQSNELWCDGGESRFIRRMAAESRQFSEQVLWFSTLVSKKENVRPLQRQLVKMGVEEVQIHEMSQGQKVSRFVAWTFHKKSHHSSW